MATSLRAETASLVRLADRDLSRLWRLVANGAAADEALHDLLPAIEIALSRFQQIVALESEVSDLAERFETRKLVDRAKGILNDKMGLSEPEAFRWIQKASMDRRLTMQDVAKTIIDQLGAKKD